jgi:hypothetical protein
MAWNPDRDGQENPGVLIQSEISEVLIPGNSE